MTNSLIRMLSYLRPYWKPAVLSILMLSVSVMAELQIPRLLQSIIDTGIPNKDLCFHRGNCGPHGGHRLHGRGHGNR